MKFDDVHGLTWVVAPSFNLKVFNATRMEELLRVSERKVGMYDELAHKETRAKKYRKAIVDPTLKQNSPGIFKLYP